MYHIFYCPNVVKAAMDVVAGIPGGFPGILSESLAFIGLATAELFSPPLRCVRELFPDCDYWVAYQPLF